ncbi:MAG TPA: Crp/Fnr family transcriptional regulator, partial [Anaerolineaceae bacterium]|nr:Crp/Fnr family transcriptional regulator [Anaerolineaceae bacterium]
MQAQNNDLKGLLSGHPLLSLLDEKALQELCAQARLFTLETGNLLYEAGSETNGAFLLAAGKMELVCPENTAKSREIMRGELFGDEGLDGLTAFLQTARALTESAVWYLPDGLLREALQSNPRAAMARSVLLQSRQLAERVRMPWIEKDEQVQFITRKHPVFLLMSLLLPLMGFAALVAVGAWLGTLRPDITVPLFIGGFILCLLWLAW